jgi:prevent-host-death family protein
MIANVIEKPNAWKLYDAKNQLSELVGKAAASPQTITVRGKEAVVVMSVNEYKKITEPTLSLSDVVFDPYLADVELDLERDKSSGERGTPFELSD